MRVRPDGLLDCNKAHPAVKAKQAKLTEKLAYQRARWMVTIPTTRVLDAVVLDSRKVGVISHQPPGDRLTKGREPLVAEQRQDQEKVYRRPCVVLRRFALQIYGNPQPRSKRRQLDDIFRTACRSDIHSPSTSAISYIAEYTPIRCTQTDTPMYEPFGPDHAR